MRGLIAHKKHCGVTKKMRFPMRVRLGARERGIMRFRLKVDDLIPIIFNQVEVFLIDENWEDLLIGREILGKLEALPEQVLKKIPEEIRKTLGG